MSELLLRDDSVTLGKIIVESDDGVVIGDFIRLSNYDKYAELFCEYEAAANDQLLVEIDRLDKIIDSYGFIVTDPDGSRPRSISDLQIGASRISFRWANKERAT